MCLQAMAEMAEMMEKVQRLRGQAGQEGGRPGGEGAAQRKESSDEVCAGSDLLVLDTWAANDSFT